MVEKRKHDTRTELTKENIIEVASGLFVERGITNVAFDDIAKAAGYSRTTVYAHFSGKEDIIHYIALRTMTQIHELMQKVIKQPVQADQQLKFVSYDLINICNDKPFYYKCMLEYLDASPEGRAKNPILEEIYQIGEKLNDGFACIIDAGVAQGIFRSDLSVLPTGLILWSCITSLISLLSNKQAYIESKMQSTQQFYDYGFNLILRTVLKDNGPVV